MTAYETLHRPFQAQHSELTGLANSAANGDIRELVDLINKSLKRISDNLEPVSYVDVPVIFEIPDQYIISPETVLAKLERIKAHRAPGPDELPNNCTA